MSDTVALIGIKGGLAIRSGSAMPTSMLLSWAGPLHVGTNRTALTLREDV
jgi:hypothetical protein